jgi:uncharacterized protein with PIN domain
VRTAEFRFYEELNDFLPPERRKVSFRKSFRGRVSIKDMIESLGVPHAEVELILVNGESVDFSYLVRDQDRISVYPMFESLDITPLLRLRPAPLRECRFAVDSNLGRLATHLRLLGFDTLYRNDFSDEEIVALAAREGRIVLTRDRRLLMRSEVVRGYFVRATQPLQQTREILQRLDLASALRPFTRCLECNGPIEAVAKTAVADRLPPRVIRDQLEFWRCKGCDRVYWKGSHYSRLEGLVRELRRPEREISEGSGPAAGTKRGRPRRV